MDDGLGNIKVFPDHFEASTPTRDHLQKKNSPISESKTDCSFRSYSRSSTRRKLMKAASMLNLFNIPRLPWGTDGQDKVELSAAEVESLRTEILDLEEREAHLKAQLEQLDVVLRSARLAGYLYIRTRWTALPGEPPIDDTDVDDWLPRFLVLHGSCIFFYLRSTDLSPQDSTLLSDIVEVGPRPSFIQEDEQTRFSFYILTHQGLRFECSSLSKIQVDAWLTALRIDCKLEPDTTAPQESRES
ncbi:Pleckstrin homology domain [Macleaya cordata]|uniref:Pleckstrin homology domain n=1 Tax=Macleaya cordata TaxID=56857 RepID=A0A200QW60_MACCD|nr:Pleckstrin homology domain [Macleaya cordata]